MCRKVLHGINVKLKAVDLQKAFDSVNIFFCIA